MPMPMPMPVLLQALPGMQGMMTAMMKKKMEIDIFNVIDYKLREKLIKGKMYNLSSRELDFLIKGALQDNDREKRLEAVELATSLMFKLGTRPVADGIERDYHQGLRDMRDAIAKAHGVGLSE
jgi:hypothetical protein